MGKQIRLELLSVEEYACHGGKFPMEMRFRASRVVTEKDAKELDELICPLVKQRMRGCDMAEDGFPWGVAIDVNRDDPTLARAKIALPCLLASDMLAMTKTMMATMPITTLRSPLSDFMD